MQVPLLYISSERRLPSLFPTQYLLIVARNEISVKSDFLPSIDSVAVSTAPLQLVNMRSPPPEPPTVSDIHSTAHLSAFLAQDLVFPEVAEACQRLHVPLKELYPRDLAHFAASDAPLEVQELRLQHYEKKRQHRLKRVFEELTGQGLRLGLRNRTQDGVGLRRLRENSTPFRPSGTLSVSPALPSDTPKDLSDLSSTEVSVHERRKDAYERRKLAQERALQNRLSDIAQTIAKLEAKEVKFEQVREELKLAETAKLRKLQQRSQRIQDNLLKKRHDQESFEIREARKGLRESLQLHSGRVKEIISPAVSRAGLRDGNGEEETERLMGIIQQKLDEGAERVSERRNLKALSLAAKYDQYRKARERVESDTVLREQARINLALKLKEQQEHSSALRQEHLKSVLQHRPTHKLVQSSRPSVTPDPPQHSPTRPALLDPLKLEKDKLKLEDLAENKNIMRVGVSEMRQSILWKHQNLATSLERRSQEQSTRSQNLLKEEFQRQLQREQLRRSMESKIQDLHRRFLSNV